MGVQPFMLTGNAKHAMRPDPAHLAQVAATRTRLQAAETADEAVEAIREVIANLLGSEEMALYSVDRECSVVWLRWSFGVDANRYMMFDLMQEPHLAAAVDGATFLRNVPDDENLLSIPAPVNGLIPLLVDGQTVGVLVVFGLLTQKEAFDHADFQVCQAISNYGAKAMNTRPWTPEQE